MIADIFIWMTLTNANTNVAGLEKMLAYLEANIINNKLIKLAQLAVNS